MPKTRSKIQTQPKKLKAKKKESVKATSTGNPKSLNKKYDPKSQTSPTPGMIHIPAWGFENAFESNRTDLEVFF